MVQITRAGKNQLVKIITSEMIRQSPPALLETSARMRKVGTTMKKWMTTRAIRSVKPPKYAAAVPTTAEITVVPIDTVRAIISDR
ncbi:hypothetical protein ABE10_10930 [Bacillus toyonensis]|nr:hypothetical protein [Bacillus toyonensis]